MSTESPTRRPLGDAHLLGAFHGEGLQRALPGQPGQGPDRPVDRLRPPHPDRVRPGLARGGRRGGQGRRPGGPPGPHGRTDGRHPGGRDEHLDDHQRHGGLAARALRGARPGPGRGSGPAVGDHAERHHQGVPEPRHVHLPARAQPAPHRGHHRLHGAPGAEMEPHQRLQLPPPRSGGHADPGDRLRAGHRHRRARRRAGLGQDRAVGTSGRGGAHQFLREFGRPLRGGDLQDAGLHRHVGPDLRRALRRRRSRSSGASATGCRSTRSD